VPRVSELHKAEQFIPELLWLQRRLSLLMVRRLRVRDRPPSLERRGNPTPSDPLPARGGGYPP
jgi:hypothetical protein